MSKLMEHIKTKDVTNSVLNMLGPYESTENEEFMRKLIEKEYRNTYSPLSEQLVGV